jgi:hypothetical protein
MIGWKWATIVAYSANYLPVISKNNVKTFSSDNSYDIREASVIMLYQ